LALPGAYYVAGMMAYKDHCTGLPDSFGGNPLRLIAHRTVAAVAQASRVLRRFLAHPLNNVREAPLIGLCVVLNVETLMRFIDIIGDRSSYLG